jgi:drug/metabolite transporter (DMT)-like permease
MSITMIRLTQNHYGIIFALVTACGLGAITTQAKIVYADGSNALTLMLIRFLVSTLVFGFLLSIRRSSFIVARSQFIALVSIGLVWSGAMICYLTSVETISVSLAVLILYTYPLLVLVYSIIRRQLAASLPLFCLFALAFIGLYLALSGGNIEVNLKGLIFACLASLGAAYTFIRGARVASRMSPLLMTFWVNATGLLMILPMMTDSFVLPQTSPGLIAVSAATLFYLVAILSQFQALARLPAANAAFFLNLEPVVSIILASLVLNEMLSLQQWSGVVLVISVVILSLRFKPKSASTA